jgi:hypothetical protein
MVWKKSTEVHWILFRRLPWDSRVDECIIINRRKELKKNLMNQIIGIDGIHGKCRNVESQNGWTVSWLNPRNLTKVQQSRFVTFSCVNWIRVQFVARRGWTTACNRSRRTRVLGREKSNPSRETRPDIQRHKRQWRTRGMVRIARADSIVHHRVKATGLNPSRLRHKCEVMTVDRQSNRPCMGDTIPVWGGILSEIDETVD